MLLIFMLFLRKVQRNWTVRMPVNELLHFPIRSVPSSVRRAWRHTRAVAKHAHPCRDAKCAGHIVRDNDCRHMAVFGQLLCELIYYGGHDWIKPRSRLIAE